MTINKACLYLYNDQRYLYITNIFGIISLTAENANVSFKVKWAMYILFVKCAIMTRVMLNRKICIYN